MLPCARTSSTSQCSSIALRIALIFTINYAAAVENSLHLKENHCREFQVQKHVSYSVQISGKVSDLISRPFKVDPHCIPIVQLF